MAEILSEGSGDLNDEVYFQITENEPRSHRDQLTSARGVVKLVGIAAKELHHDLKSMVQSIATPFRELDIDELEIELNIGIQSKGNIYIAEVSGSGNIRVVAKWNRIEKE